jgi:hypothetical protein
MHILRDRKIDFDKTQPHLVIQTLKILEIERSYLNIGHIKQTYNHCYTLSGKTDSISLNSGKRQDYPLLLKIILNS